LVLLWFLGRVDPDGSRDLGRFGVVADKPFGCFEERVVQGDLAGGLDCVGLPEVDLVWRHQADSCVMMVLVIPGKEAAAECAGLFDGLEPFGEFRLVFQGLEVGLREGVVV
jgi:hypothetical protein